MATSSACCRCRCPNTAPVCCGSTARWNACSANVIRRREETAATRSLLNTAKVMEGNPIALRMKELETLERVAERIDKISVFGGLDQVLNGLVKLR